jgi:hypothetical protein
VGIAGHLLAVAALVLAAPSGPWPVAGGSDWATPPQFARSLGEWTLPALSLIKMTHNYHFLTNRPAIASRFDVRLRDASGQEMATLRFPDPNALWAARFRQKLLAQGLDGDDQVEPLPGEFVPAPGQPVRAVPYWQMGEGRTGKLATVEEHLIPRDREVTGPSPWSMLLARSYARYLCRAHQAASAEVIRYTKDHIPPDVLFLDSPPPASSFDEVSVSFGVFHAPNTSDESNQR